MYWPSAAPQVNTALDAEKAFDVVDHIHLFWRIYHPDITGSTWLLIKELHRKTNTQVKSGGEISKPYVNHQAILNPISLLSKVFKMSLL
jgi:hypothetical protein